MKVVVSKEPKSQVKLTITIEAEDFTKYEGLALKRLGENVTIKGFRRGNVPLDVLRKHIGEEALKAETIDIALPQTYAEAIEREKLEVISRPTVDFESPQPGDDRITYFAIVAVMPEVEVGNVESIKIEAKEGMVTDDDIEKVLEDVKRQNTSYSEADESAIVENGDRVELDFEGFDEGGASLDGTVSKNHPVVVGSKSFVPGFEDNVLGLKKGEKKEFDVTFPTDYFQKSFQNKKVKFNIEVNRIEKAVSPEFDAEFLKKITGKDISLDDLKKEIGERILEQKTVEERKRREVEFLEALGKLTKMEIPPQIIEDEIDFMVQDLKHDLGKKGLKYENYLGYLKKTEKEHRKEYEDEAARRIALRFGLRKVYERENIEIDDNAFIEAVSEIVSYYPEKNRAEIEAIYENRESSETKQLLNRMKLDKVLAKYLK